MLFDLQVNGFAGVDFQKEDLSVSKLEHAVHALLRHGTSRILLTLITDRVDALCRKFENIERLRAANPLIAAVVVGYHLEGPWLSPVPGFHGAHDPALMSAPYITAFERMQAAAGGNIRLITLAPELPNAAAFIADVTRRSIRVAAGHTDASESVIDEAIAAGLTLCTHLGNGVPARLHRHDNIIQRLLARDELAAVFIPDGIHVPPATLRNFVRAKPRRKVLFTTDCMAAAGAPAGHYTLGVHLLEVSDDGMVRAPGSETFAGSSLTMDRAVINVAKWLGWSADEARGACSHRVAEALGYPAISQPDAGKHTR